jgi:heme/copper-type cytochrome/quinol oxidase subunit 1
MAYMLCTFKGSFTVWNHHRYTDGVGISNTDSFAIIANSADAEILLMEVPMRL